MYEQQIPLFKDKINSIFNEYKIHPLVSLDKFVKKINLGKYNYRTICLDKEGNKYFFKIDFLKNKLQKPPLKNEITFFKLLSNKDNLFEKKTASIDGLRMQKSKSYDRNGFEWILYYYSEGKVAGNIFSFNKDFIDNRKSFSLIYITDLTEKLYEILKKNKKIISLKLLEYDYSFFIDNIKKSFHICKDELMAVDKKAILEYFTKNRKLLDKCDSLAHKDNHTMNFIINDKGEVTIIDWSSICLSNRLYDFAEIWVHGYEFPDWQNKIKKMYFKRSKNKKGTEELFKMMMFFLTLKEIEHLKVYPDLVLGINGGDKKKAEEFFKKSIEIHSKRIKNIIL